MDHYLALEVVGAIGQDLQGRQPPRIVPNVRVLACAVRIMIGAMTFLSLARSINNWSDLPSLAQA